MSSRGPAPPLGNVSSATLVSELHSRKYSWEVLHAAGLGYGDFSELELVSWLRRAPKRFRSVLSQASLGLGAFSSAELLKEVSGRPDLDQALAATGLGSGSDFSCAEDEAPRDGGCQIRCQGGKACQRAHQVCAKIKHCVHVDVNRAGSWATLKSLQVFAPRPPTEDFYVVMPATLSDGRAAGCKRPLHPVRGQRPTLPHCTI